MKDDTNNNQESMDYFYTTPSYPYFNEVESSFSANIGHIAMALAQAQAEFSHLVTNAHAAVERGVNGRSYSYDYITLDKLINDVTQILSKHDIAVTSPLDGEYISTMLIHKSGQWIKSKTKAYNYTDKLHWQGQNLTYKRRHMLLAILNLHAGSDDDGNTADGNLYGKDKNEIAEKKGAEVTRNLIDKLNQQVSFDIVGIKEGEKRLIKLVNEYLKQAELAGINLNNIEFDRALYKDIKNFVRTAPKSTIKSQFEFQHLLLKK